MNWIQLAQVRVQWLIHVDSVICLLVL